MIPSVLARQLDQGIRDFIGATFPMASPYFEGMVEAFLDKPGNVFKGPYYQLGLPYRHGERDTIPFDTIRIPGFKPWAHQDTAWERLAGEEPRSTLVATGTGSGKTECFLYPLLDYCARHPGSGIKAIILYPMNALADDQARRIASLIASQKGLEGLRAGVYTGSASETRVKTMGPDGLITDRDTLREYPPDILLTNYKMLDLLLLRARDRSLWKEKALKFLVVDELHSFDGAQGTDLACLIRRLRERLDRTNRESLACIGTSATLGSGAEAKKSLLEFARQVFHAHFDEDALVEESRETEREFLSDAYITRIGLPDPEKTRDLLPFPEETPLETGEDHNRNYLNRQMTLWFPDIPWTGTENDRITLGLELKAHGVFQNILRYVESRSRSVEEISAHIRKTWAPARTWTDEHVNLCIDSLFALISHARKEENGRIVPFLTVRTQFWMRELRRLVAGISVPEAYGDSVVPLRLADEIPPGEKRTWLPVIHCRECNNVGWLTREAPGEAPVIKDLRSIYNGYFGEAKDTIILYPVEEGTNPPEGATLWKLCPECGFLSHESASRCDQCFHERLQPVWKSRLLNGRGKFDSSCPRCGSAGDLSIMGAKAASLLAALVGQTFASPFNTDKKLLAFSDSVQDAAHRAGFLTARAWTFSFRTALCSVITREGRPLTLVELSHLFLEYWIARTETSENFVGTFLPPDQEWTEDYEKLLKEGTLRPGSLILEKLTRRLTWEIASEFTFRSRIGRTLERTATAIASVDRDLLQKAAHSLAREVTERQERFRSIQVDEPLWEQYVWGITYRLKNLGALNEPAIVPLFDYGTTFPFHRTYKHMPRFPKRAPHIVTEKPCKAVHEPLFATDRLKSWFETWTGAIRDRLLPEFSFDSPEEDRELLHLALKALADSEIVTERELPGDLTGSLLEPRALMVSAKVARFRCSRCGGTLEVSEAELDLVEGMGCLKIGCRGVWRQETRERSDYYRNFYRRGEVVRINGREHTGLLGGKERKQLEESFISGAHPWDPNLLSATPTLEMGINIGDLSTVFLCSVPPGVANYLQRIGRAGRLDGNANVLSMANAVPHDQYFFQSPREMIEGTVDTPAIYDRAVAVLERHLTAYALSRWTQDLPPHIDPVPRSLGDLVAARNGENRETFPLAFFDTLGRERDSWLSGFFRVFDYLPEGGDEQKYLKDWLSDSPEQTRTLGRTIAACLDGVSADLESMRLRRKALKKQAADIREQGTLTEELQKECENLDREAEALRSGIDELKRTETWQFLCDEGILPNYAFPETGVKLKATFYRKSESSGKGQFDYRHVELVRSASSALREFAPENEFFGNGHRMKINRVDLKASRLETWRFCPACSHAVDQSHPHFTLKVCPVCQSNGWEDVGQVHSLLRFRQVYSFSSFEESLISDSQEDREPTFYNTKLLVDFDPADPDNRYFGLEDRHTPFAIEFIRRAAFREINFGKIDGGTQGFAVAGELDSKAGFPLCTQCGTLDPAKHAPDCPNRKRTEDEQTPREVIHLYHEFTSEAIRILLPVNEFPLEADIAVESALAGVYLGLKRHFGGRADHLRITQERSERPGGASLRYLVIYDSIPGGSGYLKDFFTEATADGTTTFFTVLEKASEALRDCSCRHDSEKDGCYRCVLSHKVSRKMKDVSRSMALKILDRILSERESLSRRTEQAASRVDPLYDSRLEELFVGVLQNPELWPVAVTLKPEIYRGKTGHYAQIGNRGYHLEQQVLISVREPLPATTRADFVFQPIVQGEKPLVVYTDGFRFHRESIAEDIRIRQALISSGLYRVFSLSWDDVVCVAEHRPSALHRAGHPWITSEVPSAVDRALRQLPLARGEWPGTTEETGMIALIAMLSLGEADRERLWLAKAQFSITRAFFSCTQASESVEALSGRTGITFSPGARHGERFLGTESRHTLTLVQSPPKAAEVPDTVGWVIFDDTEDFSREDWNGMLECMNYYQVLPRFAFGSKTMAADHEWMAAAFGMREREVSPDWAAVADCVLATWKPLVFHLHEQGVPLPEVGYEELNAEGLVSFTAELAWPDRRLAILAAAEELPKMEGWRFIQWNPDKPFPDLDLGVVP